MRGVAPIKHSAVQPRLTHLDLEVVALVYDSNDVIGVIHRGSDRPALTSVMTSELEGRREIMTEEDTATHEQ